MVLQVSPVETLLRTVAHGLVAMQQGHPVVPEEAAEETQQEMILAATD